MNFAKFRAVRLDYLIKSGVSCFSAKNMVTSAEFRAEYERKEAAERAAKEAAERAAVDERVSDEA